MGSASLGGKKNEEKKMKTSIMSSDSLMNSSEIISPAVLQILTKHNQF